MKRTFLSVKELAHELGISQDSVYRAFRAGEIPGAQIARTIRFDLSKVQRAMEERAKAMPNRRCTTRATGGASRRRDGPPSPRLVKRGRKVQPSTRRSV